MSRGHGQVERALLAFIEGSDQMHDTASLTAEAYQIDPNEKYCIAISHTQLSSVRRALRKLVREGRIVDCGRNWRWGRRHWATEQVFSRYSERLRRMRS